MEEPDRPEGSQRPLSYTDSESFASTSRHFSGGSRLSGDLTSGSVRKVITSSLFEVPTTVARFGDRLAAVNAKFDTGIPPTATSFEVVVVDR